MDFGIFPAALAEQLRGAGVVTVLVLDRLEDAVPLARTLVDAGLPAIELTLRTEIALEAIAEIQRDVPEMIIGAGTVIRTEQVHQAAEAGAAFAVAPGTNVKLIAAAAERGLPFAPGICTPSDIEAAVELGCRLLKFFPAQPIGGLDYLRSIQSPFAHLGLRFLPLGGVNPTSMREYLREPAVQCVGGSWIAPRKDILAKRWDVIGQRAREARQLVDAIAAECESGTP
jgi:2-dehydro-3-deoxyphosphogluconate aldolase/(4S)-4-hydroxy-2-oxoglutarate aldolase